MRTIFLFLLLLLLTTTNSSIAHAAGVSITEIMYDPSGPNTGHQWIEIKNTGASSLDLSSKTVRLTDTKKSHLIKAYSGSAIIPAGGIAVITKDPEKFLLDWPHFSGTVLKSAFSLKESGSVGLTDGGNTLASEVTYSSADGAKGDGNSLQRLGARFVVGAPTPGLIPSKIPTPLVGKVKPTRVARGSSKRKNSNAVTSTTYAHGTLAPVDSADAASAGAFNGDMPLYSFTLPEFLMPYIPLFSSVWFASFLAIVGFSAFTLIVLQKRHI